MNQSDNGNNDERDRAPLSEQQILQVLTQVGVSLGITVDRSDVHAFDSMQGTEASIWDVLRVSINSREFF